MSERGARQQLRAGIYTRVSSDQSGRARSPQEQQHDAERDAERNGWTVLDVYRDNDRGASRHSKGTRPEFERLKVDLAAGRLDVVIAWEASRFTRDLRAFAELRDLVRDAGVLYCYGGRVYDFENPDDARIAGYDAVNAEHEAGLTRKRTKRALDANRETGHGLHGVVQFGYRRIRDPRTGRTIGQEPDEDFVDGTLVGPAVAVRLMFERLAAGASLPAVARELNDLGYRTGYKARGGTPDTPWTPQRVKQQTQNAYGYLGLRVHKGAPYDDAVRWTPLVSREVFDTVQGVYAARSYGTGRDRHAQSLLVGIATCGVCGGRIRYAKHADRYRCIGKPGEKQNGCLTRRPDQLDASITDLAVDRLSRPDVFGRRGEPSADEIAQLSRQCDFHRARLAEAEGLLLADEDPMPPAAYAKMVAQLQPKIDELEARIVALRVPVPAVLQRFEDAAEETARRWEAAPLEAKRELLRLLFDEIRVHKAPYGGAFGGYSFRYAGDDELHEVAIVRPEGPTRRKAS